MYLTTKDTYPFYFHVPIIRSQIRIFVYMESILIHPESAEQLKAVKAVLKVLKVPFESQAAAVPSHVSQSIEESIKQYKEGKTISLDEFKKKHFSPK